MESPLPENRLIKAGICTWGCGHFSVDLARHDQIWIPSPAPLTFFFLAWLELHTLNRLVELSRGLNAARSSSCLNRVRLNKRPSLENYCLSPRWSDGESGKIGAIIQMNPCVWGKSTVLRQYLANAGLIKCKSVLCSKTRKQQSPCKHHGTGISLSTQFSFDGIHLQLDDGRDIKTIVTSHNDPMC